MANLPNRFPPLRLRKPLSISLHQLKLKMLERLVKQPYLYDEEQNKLIREQLEIAKNELAMIEEKTSKGFK